MRASPLIFILLGILYSQPTWAMYKVVGPDGKVTFTDRPPAGASAAAVAPPAQRAASHTELPSALSQVAAKSPVLLYTRGNCSPCDAGREHLKARGIPFSEKSVNSEADAVIYQQREGTSNIPLVRVGTQRLHGFNGVEWNAALDTAGYPAKSTLPTGYVHPPAQALAPIVSTESPPPAQEGLSNGTVKPRGPNTAPQGIRF